MPPKGGQYTMCLVIDLFLIYILELKNTEGAFTNWVSETSTTGCLPKESLLRFLLWLNFLFLTSNP